MGMPANFSHDEKELIRTALQWFFGLDAIIKLLKDFERDMGVCLAEETEPEEIAAYESEIAETKALLLKLEE